MPGASFVPPDPSRQDWGVFEQPNSLDSPQDIAGETEDQRRKEAFKNVMRAAAYLFETDPRGLFDLVRLLGREEQSRRMALPLSFPSDVLRNYQSEPDDLWFSIREPLNDVGEGFEDLAPQIEVVVPVSPTADLVMPEPWSKERLLNAVPRIGAGREWGPFRQDPNHLIELWLPIRVAWVFGGNHSITAVILRAEGELESTIVRELDPLYDHVACDGEVFFRLRDQSTIGPVFDHEWAAIFEIGRYLREAQRRRRL